MADYWKSQAKKFCEFCKCWITDNKPSVEFHERGKKHKENVQLKIKSVRKKGTQTVQDNDEFRRTMEAIEAAAMEAHKKDLGIEDSADDISEQTAANEQRSTTKPWPTSNPSRSTGQTIKAPVASVAETSDEKSSSVTQWEIPDCLDPSKNEEDDEESKEEKASSAQETENQDKEDKTDSPYGSWTTVRVIEKPESTSNPLGHAGDGEPEDPEETAKKTEKKFKEKATPKIAFQGKDTEVVAFKKRKLNSERKRNIRQTKFDS